MDEEASDLALWQQAMREIYGGRDDVEVARLTGISQPWVNQVRNGRIPSRRTLLALVDTLAAPTAPRRTVFRIAGYADPESDWDPDAAFMDGIRELQAEFGPFQISTEAVPLSRETPEGIAAALAAIRARLEDRRA